MAVNSASRFHWSLGLIVLFALPGDARERQAPEAEVYHGFTLLDPATEKRVTNAWLVVEHGRLARVGRGKPPAASDPARAHDLRGRFVLPGLIDAHAHIAATGILQLEIRDGAPLMSMKVDDNITRRNALVALAHGVTTVRNPAGSTDANARYDRKVASGTSRTAPA